MKGKVISEPDGNAMIAVRILAIIGFMMLPQIARAMTVGEYQHDLIAASQDPNFQATLNAQVDGLMNGIQMTSAYYVVVMKAPRVFCEPPKLVITGSEEFEVLNDWIKQANPSASFPLGEAALLAFIYAFPCQP